jgi:hypothetical protein
MNLHVQRFFICQLLIAYWLLPIAYCSPPLGGWG